MAISPFHARPMTPGNSTPERERRRARLVVAICILGIAAALLAYAISPGVRHAVGHAAHSVKHAVSHVFDPDNPPAHHHHHHAEARLVSPLRTGGRAGRHHGHTSVPTS
jgi:hypothetical protein